MSEQARKEGLAQMSMELRDERLRLEGWRVGIAEHGQELWRIYHWIADAHGEYTSGACRIRDWLDRFNVPDNTEGKYWASSPGGTGE